MHSLTSLQCPAMPSQNSSILLYRKPHLTELFPAALSGFYMNGILSRAGSFALHHCYHYPLNDLSVCSPSVIYNHSSFLYEKMFVLPQVSLFEFSVISIPSLSLCLQVYIMDNVFFLIFSFKKRSDLGGFLQYS